ncbi:MAG: hypothetical protein AAFY55_19125, partial [Bacteroidota bacterium]
MVHTIQYSDADSIMVGFQATMARFLETQERVMLASLGAQVPQASARPMARPLPSPVARPVAHVARPAPVLAPAAAPQAAP